jgi:hypothetical protein
MNDHRIYTIRVQGALSIADIEHFCPPGLKIEESLGSETILIVNTDQSGLIGLMRNLHNLGIELLAFDSCSSDV